MNTRKKRTVCYILALLMLISGMCFEIIEADSLFEYGFVAASGSYIASDNRGISSEDACTREMLGDSTSFFENQLTNRSVYNKKEHKVTFVFLYVNIFLYLCSKFFVTANIVQPHKLYGSSVVLHFIHNKDGKKRA